MDRVPNGNESPEEAAEFCFVRSVRRETSSSRRPSEPPSVETTAGVGEASFGGLRGEPMGPPVASVCTCSPTRAGMRARSASRNASPNESSSARLASDSADLSLRSLSPGASSRAPSARDRPVRTRRNPPVTRSSASRQRSSATASASSSVTGKRRRNASSDGNHGDDVVIISGDSPTDEDEVEIVAERKASASASASSSAAASSRTTRADGNKQAKGVEAGDCPVCYDTIITAKGMPNGCSHVFCSACILHWAETCTKCPICRESFSSVKKETVGKRRRVTHIPVEERSQERRHVFTSVGIDVGGIEVGHFFYQFPFPPDRIPILFDMLFSGPLRIDPDNEGQSSGSRILQRGVRRQ
eukprot:gb/GECG01007542.1/.p1 GENE.gb/GECG01007542.1/~~gb/GECG01007542.1/.p1  ORF type:complete len:358 (+),score=43.58 gb/GECG01007542.1/:1-1074(+)